jgi:hypothetical protein
VRAQGRRRGGDAEPGCGVGTGSVTGAARSGSTRAPEVGDDRRVPPVGETQEEGGDAGRNGPRGLAGWAAKAEKASWAARTSWAARGIWARREEGKGGKRNPFAIFKRAHKT